MPWSPLKSAVSVLVDIKAALDGTIEGDDLSPDEIVNLLDEIDSVFALDEVKAVIKEFEEAAKE